MLAPALLWIALASVAAFAQEALPNLDDPDAIARAQEQLNAGISAEIHVGDGYELRIDSSRAVPAVTLPCSLDVEFASGHGGSLIFVRFEIDATTTHVEKLTYQDRAFYDPLPDPDARRASIATADVLPLLQLARVEARTAVDVVRRPGTTKRRFWHSSGNFYVLSRVIVGGTPVFEREFAGYAGSSSEALIAGKRTVRNAAWDLLSRIDKRGGWGVVPPSEFRTTHFTSAFVANEGLLSRDSHEWVLIRSVEALGVFGTRDALPTLERLGRVLDNARGVRWPQVRNIVASPQVYLEGDWRRVPMELDAAAGSAPDVRPPRVPTGPVAPAEAGPISAPLLTSRSSPPRHADSIPDGKSGWLACDAALDWLVRHQRADGSWDGAEHGAGCSDPRCTEDVRTDGAVIETSLAVIAIGATGWGATRRRAFDAGIAYLISVQDADGAFPIVSGTQRVLGQAIATEALCRNLGADASDVHRDAARRAAEKLLSRHDRGRGWSELCDDALSDLRVTTWATLALADARRAGVDVPNEVYRAVLDWVDTGVGGASPAAAAMRTCCRLFCGTTLADPGLLADHEILVRAEASGDAELEPLDAGTRYLLTVAEFYWGGDAWDRRRTETASLLPQQRGKNDGCLMGSWDGRPDALPPAGRVAATALTSMLFDCAYISTYRNVMRTPLIPR